MVLVAEALARHLLGRQQRQRDDVVAQAARRGAGLGIDLDLGVGQDPLALALSLGDELRALALALLAALLAKLVGLLAGLPEPGLVVVEQRGRLVAAALGLPMLDAMSSRRFSMAAPTGPNTYRFRMNRVIPKMTRVQIIRPGLAFRSGLSPLSSSAAAWRGSR